MTANEAQELTDEFGPIQYMTDVLYAIEVAAEYGAKGIVLSELSEQMISSLNENGYRTLTMHGNTTVLW